MEDVLDDPEALALLDLDHLELVAAADVDERQFVGADDGRRWVRFRSSCWTVLSALVAPKVADQGPSGPLQSGETGPERPPAERGDRARAAPCRAGRQGPSDPLQSGETGPERPPAERGSNVRS